MKLDPIELYDDGLRELSRGETKAGKAPFVCLINHNLVGQVITERRRRAQIKEINFRRFHDCFAEQAA